RPPPLGRPPLRPDPRRRRRPARRQGDAPGADPAGGPVPATLARTARRRRGGGAARLRRRRGAGAPLGGVRRAAGRRPRGAAEACGADGRRGRRGAGSCERRGRAHRPARGARATAPAPAPAGARRAETAMSRRPGIVVLGMLTRIPVAGIVCLTLPYLVGFERLGYDVTYLEEHGANPSTFMDDAGGTERAVAYLAAVMDWFGLGGKWCFHALHDDGAYHGLSQREVRRRLRDAALIVNLHGGTPPRPEHTETDRLVFLDTDPVGFQVRATQGDPYSLELAEAHSFFFTWGLNLGQPDCLVPLPDGIEFRPTKMPVMLDLWDVPGVAPGPAFTTVANWSQPGETLEWQGETYHWSKNLEFVKFLDLPRRTGRVFELALSSYTPNALRLLREHGWRMRHGLHLSARLNDYRRYVCGSRAEFTVA